MKQEDKELLLKDLCARLPYGVKCIVKSDGYIGVISSIENQYKIVTFDNNRQEEICDIKPYLFPLSSMTEKQKKEYLPLCEEIPIYDNYYGELEICNTEYVDTWISIDWLNKNYFDYRGLIPIGLANDATGLNIY